MPDFFGALVISVLASAVILIGLPAAAMALGWVIGGDDNPGEDRANRRCTGAVLSILGLNLAVIIVPLNYAWGRWW